MYILNENVSFGIETVISLKCYDSEGSKKPCLKIILKIGNYNHFEKIDYDSLCDAQNEKSKIEKAIEFQLTGE